MIAQRTSSASAELGQRLTVKAKRIAEDRAKFDHEQNKARQHIWRSARTLWPQFTVI